jgi:hypothetical protein
MDFRSATDALCATITHEDVARELGISVQSVRQARLNGDSRGRRSAPGNWETALATLAERRVAEYQKLIVELRNIKG